MTLALALIVLSSTALQSSAADCTSRVDVLVTHEETGEAIPDVQLEAADGSHLGTTDDGGQVRIEARCDTLRRVRLSHPDFHRETRDVTPKPNEDAVVVALSPIRLVRLDDVIVLAPAKLDRGPPGTTASLDAEALSRLRGRNLAGALAELPGVSTLDAGPQSSKPVLRGQFGRRVLSLFDGVRHEAQDWGVDHAPEIDPFAAGTLSVVKGAAGVRYGPDAIGGVILVEPRRLRFEPGVDGDVHLIGVDNGLRGTAAGRVDVAHAWLPGVAVRLEGNIAKGAAVSTPGYVLGNTASEVWNAAMTVGYEGDVLGQALDLKVSLRHHQSTLGVCYCLTSATPDTLRAQASLDRPTNADQWVTTYEVDRPYQTVAHTLGLARAAIELGSLGTVSATYSVQVDDRNEFDQVRDSVTGPQFHFNLVTHAADVAFEHAPIDVTGLTLQGTAGVQGSFQENVFSGLPLIPNYRRFMGGVFAVEQLRIPKIGLGDLVVEVGARYDQLAQTAFLTERAYGALQRRGQVDEGQCTLREGVANCPLVLPAFTFTAGVEWDLGVGTGADALTVNAAFSSAARFPDADELYLGGRAPTFPVFGVGDARLTTETSTQLSLGLDGNFSFLAFSGSGFVMSVDDYIAFAPEIGEDGEPAIDVVIQGAFPRYSYRAVDALFYGADFGGVLAPGETLSVSTQVSVVRGFDFTRNGYLPFVPPPSLRVELVSNLPRVGPLLKSTALVRSTFVAKQTRSDAKIDFVPPPAATLVLDAELRSGIEFFGQSVLASIEVRNLLNQRRRDYMSLMRFVADQPGREVWLRLSLAFGSP